MRGPHMPRDWPAAGSGLPTTVDVGQLFDEQPVGPMQWRVLGLCGTVALLDGLDVQSIGLAAPAISAQLGIAPQSLGLVFSAALAGLALGAFLLGPVADRLGRKNTLVAATIWFGLFTLATALASSFDQLLVVRFLAGLGLGGAMPSFVSLASEYVPKQRRTVIVSLIWAGYPLGGVVGGLLGSYIIPTFGWPSIFIVGGIAPLLVGVLITAMLPESPAYLVNSGRPAEQVARTLRRVFPLAILPERASYVLRREATRSAAFSELFAGGRGTGTTLLWVSFFFAFMLLISNASWSPILLQKEGISAPQAAFAMAVFNFGSLFGTAFAGLLVANFGSARVLPLTMAAGAVAYLLIGQCIASAAAVNAVELAFGFLLGCSSSGLIGLAAVFYPSSVRSTGVGWATAIGRIGSFCGPLAIGALVAGRLPPQAIFAVLGLATLIGAAACLILCLRQRKSAGPLDRPAAVET